jgi:hypothetical protein
VLLANCAALTRAKMLFDDLNKTCVKTMLRRFDLLKIKLISADGNVSFLLSGSMMNEQAAGRRFQLQSSGEDFDKQKDFAGLSRGAFGFRGKTKLSNRGFAVKWRRKILGKTSRHLARSLSDLVETQLRKIHRRLS